MVNTTGGGIDLNNDGNSASDRVPGVGRNTLTGPDLRTVDLRITKDLAIYRERVKLRLIGEATNRANFNGIQNSRYAYNSITNVFTNRTDYLRPLSTFDPRILQLAVKLIF